MIEFIIIEAALAVIVCLVALCMYLKIKNKELKLQRDRSYRLYLQESERNVEKLKEDILRDDLELLRIDGYDQ
jgi:hypothetical protein